MPIAVLESVLDRAASLLDQWTHLVEDPRRVLPVEMVGPALWIGDHFLRRIPHYGAKVLADEGAGEIT